jgi:chitinase
MCFDYRGSWDTSATGAHAALYDPKSNISTSYGLTSWVRAGVPRNMVVMGLPLYGRTWLLKDPKVNGIGAPATAAGPGDDGVLIFSQVEKFNKENGATVVYDAKTVSTYSYVGTSWIGYDDSRSTTVKLKFAQALGLRGYFFWALSYDSEWEISKQGKPVSGHELQLPFRELF